MEYSETCVNEVLFYMNLRGREGRKTEKKISSCLNDIVKRLVFFLISFLQYNQNLGLLIFQRVLVSQHWFASKPLCPTEWRLLQCAWNNNDQFRKSFHIVRNCCLNGVGFIHLTVEKFPFGDFVIRKKLSLNTIRGQCGDLGRKITNKIGDNLIPRYF